MLMIDKPMPEGCDVCPLMYDYIRCNALPEGDEHEDAFHDWNFDYTKRPDWCPLKEQQQIVRCKDCANGEVCTQSWDGVQYVECHAHEEEGYDHEDGHPLDWFCADGIRQTD